MLDRHLIRSDTGVKIKSPTPSYHVTNKYLQVKRGDGKTTLYPTQTGIRRGTMLGSCYLPLIYLRQQRV